MGRIQFADIQGERSYSGARAYNQSKLANVMFTHELARRLGGGGVTATALHPGVVRTAFGAEDPGGIQRLLVPLAKPFMKSPERGAVTSIYLASADELEHPSGQYFANTKPKAVVQAQLRRGRRHPTLAGQRRPRRRPGRNALNPPRTSRGGALITARCTGVRQPAPRR